MNDSARLVRGSARPTMKDVASRAGVALKTVSRVVNGEPGVTPQTTKRVLISPGLTVVSYDAAEAGRTAAELLMRRLAGERGPSRRVELPTTLIQRGSAEFAPDS